MVERGFEDAGGRSEIRNVGVERSDEEGEWRTGRDGVEEECEEFEISLAPLGIPEGYVAVEKRKRDVLEEGRERGRRGEVQPASFLSTQKSTTTRPISESCNRTTFSAE